MEGHDDEACDNEALEALMEPYMKDVDVVYPGTTTMAKCDINFEDEEEGNDVKVKQEKGRLLTARNMQPQKFTMVVVQHSGQKRRILMHDNDNIKNYKDDLSDGHIEFQLN